MERKVIFDEVGLKLFADQVRKLRTKQGLSQEQLAFESGLTRSQIERIESVKRNVTLSTVFAISKGLQVQVKELFDFNFPETK